MNVPITGNTFDYAGSQRAIQVQAGQDGNGTNNVTITGNNLDIKLDGAGNAVAGIVAEVAVTGPPAASNTSSLCADIGGAGAASNTFTHSLGGALAGGDIRVRQRFDGTLRLPGYAGAANIPATVITYLNGRNVEVTGCDRDDNDSPLGFCGRRPCTQPRSTSLRGMPSTQRDQFARVSEPAKPAVNIEAGPSVSQPDKPVVVSAKPSVPSKPAVARTFSHHAPIAKRNVSRQQVNATTQDKTPRVGISVRPRIAPLAGETVTPFELARYSAGKTVHIQFQVTVNNPYLGGEFVSNQGTVSGSNFD